MVNKDFHFKPDVVLAYPFWI